MLRRPAVLASAVVLLLALAVPVFAGGGKSAAPGQQKEKTPSAPITISGVVESSAVADGETAYTLTDGGTTYTLEAGPKWFFGDAYPLAPYVGKSVTIAGEIHEGTTVVDVVSVDGVALREPGRPAWAGGWKAAGERHPGWSQAKADRVKAKFGDCFPPGQCKDKSNRDADGDEAPQD